MKQGADRRPSGGKAQRAAGAQRTVSGAKRPPRRKSGTGGKIFLALITFCNLLLSLLLAVQRRQETLRAVREDETVKVLLRTQKETKT